LFDGFGSDAFFIEEFDGRAEEVVECSPFASVEIIKEGDDSGVV